MTVYYVWHRYARKLGAIGVFYGVVVPIVAASKAEAVERFLAGWDRLAGQPNVSENYPGHLTPAGFLRPGFTLQEILQ